MKELVLTFQTKAGPVEFYSAGRELCVVHAYKSAAAYMSTVFLNDWKFIDYEYK